MVGYAVLHGLSIAAGEPAAERNVPNYRDEVPPQRLRDALARLDHDLPSEHWKTSAYKLTRADAASLIERNLAMELLQKLLKGELRIRDHQNVVQARSFAEMRERMLRRCQNGAVEAALVIAELVALARDVREVNISACPNTNWRSTRQWRPATAR